jgi:hypothetical protein
MEGSWNLEHQNLHPSQKRTNTTASRDNYTIAANTKPYETTRAVQSKIKQHRAFEQGLKYTRYIRHTLYYFNVTGLSAETTLKP